MRIKVVSSRKEINKIPVDEKIVHLSFRPSMEDLINVVHRCPKIEAIQLPKSYYCSVARAIRLYIQEKNIELIEGDVWGHRGDLYAYYTVPEPIMTTIANMRENYSDQETITEKITRIHKLSPSLSSYIVGTVLKNESEV